MGNHGKQREAVILQSDLEICISDFQISEFVKNYRKLIGRSYKHS